MDFSIQAFDCNKLHEIINNGKKQYTQEIKQFKEHPGRHNTKRTVRTVRRIAKAVSACRVVNEHLCTLKVGV